MSHWERHLMLVSHLGAKQSIRCGGLVWRKTCKQNSLCVRVVWQAQIILQNLIQTKKITQLNQI